MNTPVGFIISWKVPAVVETAALRRALLAAGVPLELAPDLTPPQVVARAAGVLAKATSQTDARKLSRPVSHTARQITREEVGPDSLTYTREAAIALDDQTQQVVCDDPTLAQQLPEVVRYVHDTRTASDVMRIIKQIVEDAGSDMIPVREQGGAYFVPSGHGILGRIAAFLEGVGGELSQFACTLGHGSEASVANTITDYLLKQVAELQEAVDDLNEAGIRADVKSRRLSRVAELREKARAYATLIQAQGSKITAAIDTAEATLLAKLGGGDEPAHAEPAHAEAA